MPPTIVQLCVQMFSFIFEFWSGFNTMTSILHATMAQVENAVDWFFFK